MRINNLHRLIIGTAVVGITLMVGTKLNHRTEAQVSTACQAGFILTVPNAIPNAPVTISVASTATTTPVQDAVFKINGAILGRGVQTGANGQWQMIWNAQFTQPAPYNVTAEMHLYDGTICTVPSVVTNVTGTAPVASVINAVAMPPSFQGLTNQVINFNLAANISSSTIGPIEISSYTYFNNKTTSIGSITPLDGTQILKFSTGPVAGTGYIRVTASYGGLPGKIINIPVTIQAQTATSTTSTSPTSTSTTTGTTTTSTSPTLAGSPTTPATSTTATPTDAAVAAASTASIEAEKPLRDCVFSKLGEVRYKAISSGLSRPTAVEFESINQCFSTRNNVLPSSFVPVAPSEVKNKPVTTDATVSKLENVTTNGTLKLKLNGKAKPKSLVLLYVYSEPLVLSTTADSNGDWSYALEDPLQPGKHEAYAVVDKGNGTYQRSSVFDFAVAQASASAANPNGYSLKLSSIQATAKESDSLSVIYIIGIALLTVIMLGAGVFGILRFKRNKIKDENSTSTQGTVQPTDTPAASPEPLVAPTSETIQPAVTAQPQAVPETVHLTEQPTVQVEAQSSQPDSAPTQSAPLSMQEQLRAEDDDHES